MKKEHRTGTDHPSGVVYKKTFDHYEVRAGESLVTCKLSARLFAMPEREPARGKPRRAQESRVRTDPVVVGDVVRYVDGNDGRGTIVAVEERRNQISRRSAVPGPSALPFEQVIAANLDQVVPVLAAADPAPKWSLLDRYLVAAEAMDLPALVCITKLDLALERGGDLLEEIHAAAGEYRRIGYRVILTSAATGAGLEDLRAALAGKVSVLIGKSGVGKSTLLNALEPGLGLRVSAVSQVTGKGRHTTSHLEMFPYAGGAIIDTPGTREFGLWDVDPENLPMFFPEMRPFLGRCRFGLDCEHDEEPGCAVRKAVADGQVSPNRYYSYLRLLIDA